jgi:hypothetical protein
MIVDIFYLIAGTFLQIVGWLFGLLDFVFPTQKLTTSITFMFSNLKYFGGFIDLPTLGIVIGVFLTFLTFWYSYKLILFIINIIPIPWTHPNHPTT